jgi:hypothetical protein
MISVPSVIAFHTYCVQASANTLPASTRSFGAFAAEESLDSEFADRAALS